MVGSRGFELVDKGLRGKIVPENRSWFIPAVDIRNPIKNRKPGDIAIQGDGVE